MRSSHTAKARRIAAGIMGLMMLLIVLFSAFYIAAEADHDCEGEHCSVCACIQQCKNVLRGIGGCAAPQLSFIAPALFAFLFAAVFAAEITQKTLVAERIRLNN